MRTPVRRTLSLLTGWVADRRVPTALRAPLYRAYARLTGADLSEVRGPIEGFASLSEFFVRPLREGARPIADGPRIVSPADGTLQACGAVERGSLLQAKGRPYALA